MSEPQTDEEIRASRVQFLNKLHGGEKPSEQSKGYRVSIQESGEKLYVCEYCIGIAWNTNDEKDMESHIRTHGDGNE